MLKIVGILLLSLLFLSIQESTKTHAVQTTEFKRINEPEKEDLDSAVLSVFKAKCNACHLKKKQTIFNATNLEVQVLLIQEQVLIKKRMPKRGGEDLTPGEYALIEKWVQSKLAH